MIDIIWRGALIGIGATLLMDLWAVFLWQVCGQAAPRWAGPGRWLWNLQHGTVFHNSIADAEPCRHEEALGWIFHYATGIVYGIILGLWGGPAWFANPTFLPAFIWGMVTVAAGWFLLQPGLGLGWAASKTPSPGKVRLLNLAGHFVFGLGLWGTALLIR